MNSICRKILIIIFIIFTIIFTVIAISKHKNMIALFIGIIGCIMVFYLLIIQIDSYDRNTLIPKIEIPKEIIPNARVVISFTTIPSRIKFLPEIIKNLKSQTLQPDIIYACIPYFSKRKNVKYEISDDWKFEKNVKIVRCKDYGPATKLLGCISYEPDPDTMIITIDDDHEYPPETVHIRVAYAMKYPDACFSLNGMDNNLHPINCSSKMNITDPTVKYIEGFGAPLYRRKYITNEMLDFFENKLSDECFLSDDLTISTWLQMQNVPLIVLCNYPGGKKVDKIDENDALRMYHRDHVYNICKKELEELKNTADVI